MWRVSGEARAASEGTETVRECTPTASPAIRLRTDRICNRLCTRMAGWGKQKGDYCKRNSSICQFLSATTKTALFYENSLFIWRFDNIRLGKAVARAPQHEDHERTSHAVACQP